MSPLFHDPVTNKGITQMLLAALASLPFILVAVIQVMETMEIKRDHRKWAEGR